MQKGQNMGISGYVTWEKKRRDVVVAVDVGEDTREKEVYMSVDMCCLYVGK